MSVLRKVTVALFVLVLAAFCVVFYYERSTRDDTYPVISFDSDAIAVPLDAGDDDLLRGVTAADGKDGDLTGSVIVESVSRFLTPGVCTVRYAVSDADNHVAVAERTVTYEGYTLPRFALSSSLIYREGSTIAIRTRLTAADPLEGDISDKIILNSMDLDANTAGVYHLNVSVTTTHGAAASLSLPLIVENRSLDAPEITLSDYLIYLPQGADFDPRTYILSVPAGLNVSDVSVSGTADTSTPGVYQVDYLLNDAYGRTGHEVLLVVVEQEET